MLLATHPEVQDKIANELREVFYSNDVEITYDNITKLDYLERVIKESLRLCPVVPSELIIIRGSRNFIAQRVKLAIKRGSHS